MSHTLMTHFIAGYPTVEDSLKIGKALIEGGASFLEMQIPYSDPTADGPVIAAACNQALENGFSVETAFGLCRELTDGKDRAPLYLMSYGGILFNWGVEAFVRKAAESGAAGLIIPDLAPGADEGLAAACRLHGLHCVPVMIPAMAESRVNRILEDRPEWVYLALRRGITGTLTELGPESLETLETLRKRGVHIMAGFGIQTPEQVVRLAPHCDAVIVGSQVVRKIESCTGGDWSPVTRFVRELCRG